MEENTTQAPEASVESPVEVTADEKQYAMFCHLGTFAGLLIPTCSLIVPLILWLVKKDQSAYINYHGKEAVNFNITILLASIVFFILAFALIGIPLLFATFFFWLVMSIIAAIKANDGVEYRYPLCLRLI